MIRRSAAARLARLLERPGSPGLARRAASVVWSRAANPVRPVRLPGGARVVGVGGPTLGGSYKTPLVLALARELATRGEAVAVAAHGYRAEESAPRRVAPSDDVRNTGDEALFLARELHPFDVPVVAGKPWSAVVERAALLRRTVIADGLLQASPERLDWSVLVVDGAAPWGSGRCPPAGDLRSTPGVLLGAADDIAVVVDAPATADSYPSACQTCTVARSVFRITSHVGGLARPGERALPFEAIRDRRIGLLAAIARPERVVSALAVRGIHPDAIRFFGDHRPLPEASRFTRRLAPVDLWVTTGKCATKLDSTYHGKPVWTLAHHLDLPSELLDRFASALATKSG